MADIAQPTNPQPTEEIKLFAACRAFVAAYGLPALPLSNIIQGWQNRTALPAGTNEYAIISFLDNTRHGTDLELFDKATSQLTVKMLNEVRVQVDFCSNLQNDFSRMRAQRAATVACSSVGVQFFNNHGLSCLYADDAQDLSFVDVANEYVKRSMTVLHITEYVGVKVDIEAAERIGIMRLVDVDTLK